MNKSTNINYENDITKINKTKRNVKLMQMT